MLCSAKYLGKPFRTQVSNHEPAAVPSVLTRKLLPVKVFDPITMTFQLLFQRLTGRTMKVRGVRICNLIEKMNLFPVQENPSCYAVDWSVAPSFVKEPSGTIKILEEFEVLRRSKPRKAPDLKISPLCNLELAGSTDVSENTTYKMATIVSLTPVIAKKAFRAILRDIFRMQFEKRFHVRPKRSNGFWYFRQGYNEAKLFAMIYHIPERIEIYVAPQLCLRLYPPVVIIFL